MTKSYRADLQENVVSIYDKTKTTLFGRATQKTINSNQVIGPSLSKFLDVFTDTLAGGSATVNNICVTPSGRIFLLTQNGGGNATLLLYNFNFVTGAYSYVGRLLFQLPNAGATSHTYNGFKVDDSNPAAIKVFIATVGNVTINGGLFLINNLNITDFVPIGFPTIGMAISSNAKAVYMLQDPAAKGTLNNILLPKGLTLPFSSSNAAINKKCYLHNGISTLHQYFVFDYTAAPSWLPASVTYNNASLVFNQTGHGYAANDPIVMSAGAPTGFVNTTALVHTVYFVRNPTANTFELSLTSGGASVPAGSTGTATIGRAFGNSVNNFALKTANLPTITGTLLGGGYEGFAVPAHSANAGQDCVAFLTTTNLFLGRLSDLTNLTATWPSLIASNISGTGLDIVAPSPVGGTYVQDCDSFTYLAQTSTFITKQLVNSVIRNVFGLVSNEYNEAQMRPAPLLGTLGIAHLDSENGWLFFIGTNTGQRGIYAVDLKSDQFYGSTFVTSKVFETPESILTSIGSLEELYDQTNGLKIQLRTSNLSNDTMFDTPTSGWFDVAIGDDLGLTVLQNFTQFRILFYISTYSNNASPSQVSDIIFDVVSKYESSSRWEYSTGNSSTATPTRVGFNLRQAYPTAVPTLFFRAYDKATGTLVANHNTAANPGLFEYSNNNGSTWQAVGTIPNTVNTLVRYNFPTPPGSDVRVTIRES